MQSDHGPPKEILNSCFPILFSRYANVYGARPIEYGGKGMLLYTYYILITIGFFDEILDLNLAPSATNSNERA